MLPSAVLSRFGPALAQLRWEPAPTAGFSGAKIWQGRDPNDIARVALKAYAPDSISVERLSQIHRWLHAAASLAFVPKLILTPEGDSIVLAENRLWEAYTWRPGRADFHERPTLPKLEAACMAIARLHREWQRSPSIEAPIPGIARRLAVVAESERSRTPLIGVEPTMVKLLLRAREQVRRLRGPAEGALSPWYPRRFRLQPCLCDLWHDHVLFNGDAVTGIIDYGAMKVDHASVDLARLLGSLVPGDADAFTTGLAAYRREGGLEVPDDLVMLLAETGILGSVAGWLVRFATPGYVLPDAEATRNRLEGLVSHLEKRPSNFPFHGRGVPFPPPTLLQ